MGNYAYELKEATTLINKKDFSKVLEDIKNEVRKKEWKCYGWRDDVLNAETLEDIARIFNIKLTYEGNGFYRPVVNNVYVSYFFKDLIKIVAPYMTDGKIMINDEYDDIVITFCNKQVKVVR